MTKKTIIQVIGLAGSGKTTLIQKYIDNKKFTKSKLTVVDIRNHRHPPEGTPEFKNFVNNYWIPMKIKQKRGREVSQEEKDKVKQAWHMLPEKDRKAKKKTSRYSTFTKEMVDEKFLLNFIFALV